MKTSPPPSCGPGGSGRPRRDLPRRLAHPGGRGAPASPRGRPSRGRTARRRRRSARAQPTADQRHTDGRLGLAPATARAVPRRLRTPPRPADRPCHERRPGPSRPRTQTLRIRRTACPATGRAYRAVPRPAGPRVRCGPGRPVRRPSFDDLVAAARATVSSAADEFVVDGQLAEWLDRHGLHARTGDKVRLASWSRTPGPQPTSRGMRCGERSSDGSRALSQTWQVGQRRSSVL